MPEPMPATTEPSKPRKGPRNPRADRIADFLKTVVWVIPLTIFLWFYAERTQSEKPKIAIPFDVLINSPDKRATVVDPADGKMMATVIGSKSNLDRLRALIASSAGRPTVTHTLDASTPRGTIQIPSAVIAEDPFFKNNFLTVTEPLPASIKVVVDDVITQRLIVQAAPKTEGLEGKVVFTPATVEVTAARTVFESLPKNKDGEPYLIADFSQLKSKGVLNDPGTHENAVPIGFADPVNPQGVKFERQTVSANFVVKQALTRYVPAQQIPIWPSATENFLKANDVELGSKFLANLTFEGPPEQIAKLRAAVEDATADPFTGIVKVTEVADKVLPVKFLMPKGAEDVRLVDGDERTVDVHVSPKRG